MYDFSANNKNFFKQNNVPPAIGRGPAAKGQLGLKPSGYVQAQGISALSCPFIIPPYT